MNTHRESKGVDWGADSVALVVRVLYSLSLFTVAGDDTSPPLPDRVDELSPLLIFDAKQG